MRYHPPFFMVKFDMENEVKLSARFQKIQFVLCRPGWKISIAVPQEAVYLSHNLSRTVLKVKDQPYEKRRRTNGQRSGHFGVLIVGPTPIQGRLTRFGCNMTHDMTHDMTHMYENHIHV